MYIKIICLSAKCRKRSAYQCLDNVKMYKHAKFDQNIQCGSRVMSIFTKIPYPAEMAFEEASSHVCKPVA